MPNTRRSTLIWPTKLNNLSRRTTFLKSNSSSCTWVTAWRAVTAAWAAVWSTTRIGRSFIRPRRPYRKKSSSRCRCHRWRPAEACKCWAPRSSTAQTLTIPCTPFHTDTWAAWSSISLPSSACRRQARPPAPRRGPYLPHRIPLLVRSLPYPATITRTRLTCPSIWTTMTTMIMTRERRMRPINTITNMIFIRTRTMTAIWVLIIRHSSFPSTHFETLYKYCWYFFYTFYTLATFFFFLKLFCSNNIFDVFINYYNTTSKF